MQNNINLLLCAKHDTRQQVNNKKKKKVRNAPLPFGILSSIRVNKAYSEAKEKTVILGQEIQCKAVASNKRVKNLERSGFASVSGV